MTHIDAKPAQIAKRLAQIVARVDATTDAGWALADTTDEDSEWFDDFEGPKVVTDDSTPGIYRVIAEEFGQGNDHGVADATFVAHAPDDVRWLVAQLALLGHTPAQEG